MGDRVLCSFSVAAECLEEQAVFVSEGVAYVAAGGGGLRVEDVSTPSDPTFLGSYNNGGNASGVFVSGGVAYVAHNQLGLQIIDVSTPSAPTLLGTYDTPGVAQGIAVSGGAVYVADHFGGIQIINDSTGRTLIGFRGANDALFVDTSGGDPIVFADDATASGLAYSFTTTISFSNQVGGGPPYNYSPVPDAQGYDPVVTGYRINPSGVMSAASGSTFPGFSVQLRIRVQ